MNKPGFAIVVVVVVVALMSQRAMPQITWSQPPIEIDPNVEVPPVFCGWSEPARSTQQEGSRRQWRMDADDFRCLGPIPITRIRWWGSHKAWASSEPPEQQPEMWHICVWANMVEGLEPNDLYPERIVWSVEIPNERIARDAVGLDAVPGRLAEMSFVYEVGLEPEEWFHQAEFSTNEGIFWISITAFYPADAEAINLWGWRTRPHLWGNGAVMPAIMGEWPTHDERLFPGRIYPVESSVMCGVNQAADLCFELLTEDPWVKWDQPFTGLRDWPGYTGHESLGVRLEQEGLIVLEHVADDWTCEGSDPVVAVAWHGSYGGYSYEACGCDAAAEPQRPDGFLFLAWRDGIPHEDRSGFPGRRIWECEVVDYDEVLVGYCGNGEGEPNEPAYRYFVRLPEDAWFRPDPADGVYWFAVVAVFDGSIGDLPYAWHWTDHQHGFGMGALTMDVLDVMSNRTELTEPNGAPVDMSLTLYTAPEPNDVSEPNAVPVQWPTQLDG